MFEIVDGRTTDVGVTGELNMDIFLDMKILWIFFEGHHKIELYLGVISMHFGVFS